MSQSPTTALTEAVANYINTLATTNWVKYELYKFEFAHEIYEKVDWVKQTDTEVLEILLAALRVKYSENNQAGVNFLMSAGQYNSSVYLTEVEVAQIRQVGEVGFADVPWQKEVATYNALSCWSSMLWPGALFPVYASNYDLLLEALFGDEYEVEVGSSGATYIFLCQAYLYGVLNELNRQGAEHVFRDRATEYYRTTHNARLPFAFNPAKPFTQLDRNLLVEDFMYFTERFESGRHDAFTDELSRTQRGRSVVEGARKLVTHQLRERNSGFAAKAKKSALAADPLLRCEACNMSFAKRYGPERGAGYIEAHHLEPLRDREAPGITKESDFAMLCSNCHAMVHRGPKLLDMSELRHLLKFYKDME